MPPEPLIESNGRNQIAFHYPDDWAACRYDEENDAGNAFHKTRLKGGGLSAVDFLARALDDSELVLVECKDFRQATPENLPRLSREPTADEKAATILVKNAKLKVKVVRAKPFLAEEFARNIRDTVLGLAAACRAADAALSPYGGLLNAAQVKLVCVLALELDSQASWLPGEEVRIVGLLKSVIGQQLGFLDNAIVIVHWSAVPSPPAAWHIQA